MPIHPRIMPIHPWVRKICPEMFSGTTCPNRLKLSMHLPCGVSWSYSKNHGDPPRGSRRSASPARFLWIRCCKYTNKTWHEIFIYIEGALYTVTTWLLKASCEYNRTCGSLGSAHRLWTSTYMWAWDRVAEKLGLFKLNFRYRKGKQSLQ